MSKKDTTPKRSRTTQAPSEPTRDWHSLFARQIDGVDWALDIVAPYSRDDQELQSVGHVREFVRGWFEGRRVDVPVADAVKAIAIVVALIDLELGSDSVSVLAPLRAILELPTPSPMPMYCPGAVPNEQSTVPIRRFPGYRNTNAPFTTPFAA